VASKLSAGGPDCSDVEYGPTLLSLDELIATDDERNNEQRPGLRCLFT